MNKHGKCGALDTARSEMTAKKYREKPEYKAYCKKYAREYNRKWPEKGRLNEAKLRCFWKKHPRYIDWGGRFEELGVEAMCVRYRYGEGGIPGYKCLIEDIGRAEGRQLHRTDNDKGYVVGNIKWVSAKENNRHRRNTKCVFIEGISITLGELMDRAFFELRGKRYPLRETLKSALGCDVILSARHSEKRDDV